ncbi:MAG: GDP-mannose-dependent alpha-(1-6)-phosphatidylinositol monomannoside mannosyltransferase [candidate division WS2 bacterium]|nr:MAG: glycosyltransferase family 4 protein [Methanosarcinales archaeon Met12]MBT9150145.1 GDP-mannose-dependent alpha-(1-6)-phosphatidylinositol monomannoside mannosyltransferase [Candidatus Psychracetigena formicireducens]
MKIALIVPYFQKEWGSYEYYLAKNLSLLNQDVTIITSATKVRRYYLNDRSALTADEQIEGFYVKRLPIKFEMKEVPYMQNLRKNLESGGFDIVHSTEDFQLCSWQASSYAKEHKIPLFITRWLYWKPNIRLASLFQFYDRYISTIVRNRAAAIIAPSASIKEYLLDYGVNEEKVHWIPSGVDLETFSPNPSSMLREKLGLGDEKIILSIARLHLLKGLHYLIQAYGTVARNFPNTRLVILGKGPQEKELRDMAKQLNIEKKVSFLTEHVPHEKISQLYNSADIFAFPSVVEPFGMANLEAMACGKPTVSSDTGGMRDMVLHGKTGFLFKVGDVKGIEDALMAMLSDEKKTEEMGLESRKRALEYDWRKIARQILEKYEEALPK